MNETTVRNLVDVLGKAIEARASGTAIDTAAVELAVASAVRETLHLMNLGSNHVFKKAVIDVIRSEMPGRL